MAKPHGLCRASNRSARDEAETDRGRDAAYGRKISDFADWCAKEGMPISYHHHMAAAIETEAELDLFMKHSSVPLLFDAGHMAFAGGDNLRVIENHWTRITHVHTKDIRRPRRRWPRPDEGILPRRRREGCFHRSG